MSAPIGTRGGTDYHASRGGGQPQNQPPQAAAGNANQGEGEGVQRGGDRISKKKKLKEGEMFFEPEVFNQYATLNGILTPSLRYISQNYIRSVLQTDRTKEDYFIRIVFASSFIANDDNYKGKRAILRELPFNSAFPVQILHSIFLANIELRPFLHDYYSPKASLSPIYDKRYYDTALTALLPSKIDGNAVANQVIFAVLSNIFEDLFNTKDVKKLEITAAASTSLSTMLQDYNAAVLANIASNKVKKGPKALSGNKKGAVKSEIIAVPDIPIHLYSQLLPQSKEFIQEIFAFFILSRSVPDGFSGAITATNSGLLQLISDQSVIYGRMYQTAYDVAFTLGSEHQVKVIVNSVK